MPLLYKQTHPLLAVWKMDETNDELSALLPAAFSYPDIQQVAHAEVRLKERLTALALVKELLGCEAEIRHRESGAPYLPGSDWRLSISHTKGYAAVIIGTGAAAGIDIEYRSDRVKRIRSRFMTAEEEQGIDPAHEADHLLLHWCAKETLFKLIEEEEVDFQEHLHVCPFAFQEEGTFWAWESRTAGQKRFRLAYRVAPEYVLVYQTLTPVMNSSSRP